MKIPRLLEYPEMSADQWWEAHRRQYLRAFIVSSMLAFICLAGIAEIFQSSIPPDDFEITLVTLPFQALGFLLVVLLANFCYRLGPCIENRLQLANPGRYRRIAYTLGFWFSCALPFLSPASLILQIRLHPYYGPI